MPEGKHATALARQGIDVVKGDFDDEVTLRRALAGAWGVFGVQNAGEAGAEPEEVQGKRKRTGVPHFDSKWSHRGNRSRTSLPLARDPVPVFFMENLLAPFSLQGSTLAWALGPGTKLQMISVDDIGWFGARAFTDADALNRREIDLARGHTNDAGGGGDPDGGVGSADCVRADAHRTGPAVQPGDGGDVRVVRARRLQRRHR
jgi:hypothetical protein